LGTQAFVAQFKRVDVDEGLAFKTLKFH
jgi:hypothetical protein